MRRKRLLTRAEYSVADVGSAVAARDALASSAELPHLIVIDGDMDRGGGSEADGTLRLQQDELPVLGYLSLSLRGHPVPTGASIVLVNALFATGALLRFDAILRFARRTALPNVAYLGVPLLVAFSAWFYCA